MTFNEVRQSFPKSQQRASGNTKRTWTVAGQTRYFVFLKIATFGFDLTS